MQGKPFFPAGLAAKGRPFILRLRDFHQGSAVAPLEGSADDDGADFLGVLPVQPLAVSRTKLNAPVRRLCHPYQLAAFQAAEGAQGFFFPRRTDVIVRAVPVGVTTSYGMLRYFYSLNSSSQRSCRSPPLMSFSLSYMA